MNANEKKQNAPAPSDNEIAVLEAIRATSYGSIEVVVHQSKIVQIVQIVKTEKLKLEAGSN